MVKQAVPVSTRARQSNCWTAHAQARRAARKEIRQKKEKEDFESNVISYDRIIRLASRKSSSQWPLTRGHSRIDSHATTLIICRAVFQLATLDTSLCSNCTALFSSFFFSFLFFSFFKRITWVEVSFTDALRNYFLYFCYFEGDNTLYSIYYYMKYEINNKYNKSVSLLIR